MFIDNVVAQVDRVGTPLNREDVTVGTVNAVVVAGTFWSPLSILISLLHLFS